MEDLDDKPVPPSASGTVGPADLSALDARSLLAAYRARELSPVEVVRATLDRIASEDPEVNAFCLLDGERALGGARDAEARWRQGEPAGRLDGVPVAIKDVFLTSGWPTLRGSRAVDPEGPWDADAPAVAALRRHGAVLVGKTTTPELGWKAVTDSPLCGTTLNPWDLSRTSGGSSGGSAAALAAGMVPLALGTDGGGSIRIPCSFCGLPGIKPTYGRVPAWPASPFGAVAHCGPMARSVADLALLLDVIAMPDARDWTALPPEPTSFLEELDSGIEGRRVAFAPASDTVPVDPEVAAAVRAAARAFEELGAHVEEVEPPFRGAERSFRALWSAGAAAGVSALGDPPAEVLDPGLAELATRGREQRMADYLAALRLRDELGVRMSAFHEEWDLLLTPTLPLPAFAAGRDVPVDWRGEGWPSWTPFTYPFNLTQQPAATVPCGFTRDGLPIGLQAVGPRYADRRVLRAIRAYEAAHPQPTLAPTRDAT